MSKNYLAIDYGTKRIGLAVSVATLVEPLLVLENNLHQGELGASQEVLSTLQAICREKQIEEIVLGISENEMADKTTQFAQQLRTFLEIPVHLHDETLSSVEVQARLRETGVNLSRHRGPIDHYAAALILEDFLAIN